MEHFTVKQKEVAALLKASGQTNAAQILLDLASGSCSALSELHVQMLKDRAGRRKCFAIPLKEVVWCSIQMARRQSGTVSGLCVILKIKIL